jgi:hypothetical protein
MTDSIFDEGVILDSRRGATKIDQIIKKSAHNLHHLTDDIDRE